MFVVDELAALGMDRIKVACFAARKAVEINYSTCYMKIDNSLFALSLPQGGLYARENPTQPLRRYTLVIYI